MSENKKIKTKKSTTRNQFEEKEKKVKSTLWIVLTSNFKISEKKRKTKNICLEKISKGCLPKKILEHTILSFPLLHSAGLILFNFNLFFFEVSKK